MANFTWQPNYVYPKSPEFAVHSTPSDSMKKEVLIVDVTPLKKWELLFKAVDTTTRNAILAHYCGQYGGGLSFTWTPVPSYIESGAAQTVRYSDYRETPLQVGLWEIRVTFEIVN